MARPTRVLQDNGYYHIFTRGNDRKRIFRTVGDHQFFLQTAEEYLKKFQVGIVHYCLMPNHVHILLHAANAADIPKFMQSILQVYAIYFRRRYHTVGYLFQNRYKSILIKNERHLLECGRYIERNPLRANLVVTIAQYRWSSFSYYAKGKADPTITHYNPLYLSLDRNAQTRQKLYGELLAEERLYETIVDEAFKIN